MQQDDLELLQPDIILAALRGKCPAAMFGLVELEIHHTIGSTNSQVMTNLAQPGNRIHVCLAEQQTAGRGRRGRHWVSPFGRNIYLSIGQFINLPLTALGGLSLVSGICVVEALQGFGVKDAGLKWPNDVLLAGGKLAGVLVELRPAEPGESTTSCGAVIGVGINLFLNPEEAGLIEQSWSQLSSQVPRNQLAGELAGAILTAIERFTASGFTPFMASWRKHNVLAGREVKVLRGDEQFSGIDRGVNHLGNLLLETESGLVEFHSGEVSLRAADRP